MNLPSSLRPKQSSDASSSALSSNENIPSSLRIKQKTSTPEKESPTFIEEAKRHSARTASRIAETIGGIPGDLTSLLQSGLLYGFEKLTGKEVSKETRKLLDKQRKYPTTEEFKSFSEKKTGGYTSPQNDVEKSIDEVVATAASLLGPMKFRKALGVAIGSQIAKEGLKIVGAEETGQEAGKLGTMFLLSVINPGGAIKYAASQYEKAHSLAKGATTTAAHFETRLKSMLDNLNKGVSTPGKNAVIRPTEELLAKIKNGHVPVDDLMSAKRDINTLMGDPTLLKRERKMLKGLAHEVDRAIVPYEKMNPAFSKAYRPANEIYGAVMQGDKASKFIKKILGTKSVLGVSLAESALGHPDLIIPTVTAAFASHGVAKGVDFLSRMAKSPSLRSYYMKALAAAAVEDAPTLRLYSQKIDDIMK